jgi:urease accessory protein
MLREASEVRGGRPVQATNCATGEGVEAVIDALVRDVLFTVRAA